MKKISILLPTRKRYEMFVESVESLYQTAYDYSNFEVLVAMDNDDMETYKKILEYIEVSNKKNIIIFLYERKFYRGLHHYINDMAIQSNGTSLFLWNDDAIMRSQNWDLEILNAHENSFCLLSPKVDTMEHYWRTVGVLFPIIPKKWIEITNKWAPIPAVDSWMDVLSKRLGIFQNIETVVLSHNRHDVIGGNYDEVYQDRIYDINNPEYHSPRWDIMEEHFFKLKEYLEVLN